jgi:hypothetical protein
MITMLGMVEVVRARVYLSILGYFLWQLLGMKLDRRGMEMSVREALMRLGRVKLITVTRGGVVRRRKGRSR